MESEIKLFPPIFLVGQKIYCWRCSSKMSAVSIIAENIEDCDGQVGILSGIAYLPNEIADFIQNKVPSFKLIYSKTTSSKYYGNTCPKCGVLSGDFHLHSEPGAPFFPTTEEEARMLYLKPVPINEPVKVKAGIGFGIGEMILEHAKRI